MSRRLVFVGGALLAIGVAGAFGQNIAAPKNSYAVGGIALGHVLQLSSAFYRQYKCMPSSQFADFIWCERKRDKAGGRGSSIAPTSMLHKPDGTVAYVNETVEPTFLSDPGIQNEIDRLSTSLGERARVIKMPHREGFPNAVIALWGKVELESITESSNRILTSGGRLKEGILVDFLGDFERSAQNGIPIYRLTGGTGFVWAASYGQTVRGHRRMFAIADSLIAKRQPPIELAHCGEATDKANPSKDIKDHEDRKCRLQQLASLAFKANPKFYEYLVKKTEVAGLPADIPVLRVVFQQRVFFDTDRWDIQPEAMAVVGVVAEALSKEQSGAALFVAGHTDSRGGEAHNFNLSIKRANSVAEALAERIVGPLKIWRVGFGKAIPLRPNDTAENMAVNRRVEFILASRFDAAVHVIKKQGKYLCSDGGDVLPEFCKDPTPRTTIFEAKAVPTKVDPKPPADVNISIDPLEKIVIELSPPPIIEIGVPEQ